MLLPARGPTSSNINPVETNMTDTINKFTSAALVEKIRERNTLAGTKAEIETNISRVFDAVNELTKAPGSSVRVAGFGTFAKKHKPERNARNPQSGEPIKVAAKDVLTFKPGKPA
jgi:nucleoid DNA-binding protein